MATRKYKTLEDVPDDEPENVGSKTTDNIGDETIIEHASTPDTIFPADDGSTVTDPETGETYNVPTFRRNPQLRGLKPFKPGQTGNPNGRPPDMLKGIALRIAELNAARTLTAKERRHLKRLGIDTADITVLESILLDWATSRNPMKQQMYIERIAGKVPNVNINQEINESVVKRFKNKFTDGELEEIARGADALEILLDKLPDVNEIVDVDAKDG